MLWFGIMTGGRAGLGVVAREGLYYPDAGDDRAANVRAFAAAARGARETARLFRTKGNAASARFYEDQAVRLERTLD